MSFNKPILLYSNFCDYSREFLKILVEKSINDILVISIDSDPDTRQRPHAFYEIMELCQAKGEEITQVPTIIIGNGEIISYVYQGSEAFSWLDMLDKLPGVGNAASISSQDAPKSTAYASASSASAPPGSGFKKFKSKILADNPIASSSSGKIKDDGKMLIEQKLRERNESVPQPAARF